MNTFPQSYYIEQLLTTDHDWPVPLDKHNSVKKLLCSPDPLGGMKGQIFKSCINP